MSPPVAAPSLYESVSALERHFGGAFVNNRARWGTADGVIAYRAVYPATAMMRRQIAAERLERAAATQLSQMTGPAARQAWTKVQREADGTA